MKIAVCLQIIQPRDGTSHFAMQLGQMLADAGHDVKYGELLKELRQGVYALPTLRSRLPRPHLGRRDYIPLMLNSIVDRMYHVAKRFRPSNPE